MITESLQLVYLEKTGQKILSILASNSETSFTPPPPPDCWEPGCDTQ